MCRRDLIPLVMALQHNTWFEGVCGDGVRVGGEAWEAVGRLLRAAAPPPRRLSWRAAALRHDHAARLGHALARARLTPALHTLDLSQNHIEDKGEGERLPHRVPSPFFDACLVKCRSVLKLKKNIVGL